MNNSFLLSPTMASIFFSLKWFVLPNGRRSEESKNSTKQFDEFFYFFLGKYLANSKARQTKPRGMIFIKEFFIFNNAKNN